jgi:hypothetical protein
MLADRYLAGAYGAIRQFEREVLSHEGTRDRWETRWMIQSELSPREALARFEKEIPPAPGWSRDGAAVATGTDVARTVWRHRDEKGQAWTATATFTPAPGQKGRLVVSAVVVRSAADASSK